MEVMRDCARHGSRRLLHREHRPPGRPHRRLLLRRPHARPSPHGGAGAPSGEVLARGSWRPSSVDRRLQRAVGPRPRDRPRSSSSRSTPAPRAPQRPGVQGHGISHRAMSAAHARRAASRSTRSPAGKYGSPRQVLARRRLRGRSSSPAGPSRSSRAVEDKLGTQMTRRGRGHDHRQDLQGGLPEGHPAPWRPATATAWASPRISTSKTLPELLALLAYPTSERQFVMSRGPAQGRHGRRAPRAHQDQARGSSSR